MRTVLPSHVTSRGRPTFTESNCGIHTSSESNVRVESFRVSPAASRSGSIHVEYLSAHMTGLSQVKDGIGNIL